jgi:hypothetical protein
MSGFVDDDDDDESDDEDIAQANRYVADLRGANLHGLDLSYANLTSVDFTGASLGGANLDMTDLLEANLSHANLRGARLFRTKLSSANLSNADLSGADLYRTDLDYAQMRGAKLVGAKLDRVVFRKAVLDNADLTNANLAEVTFIDVDLGNARGLQTCKHAGPSVVDFETLTRSLHLPVSFLRGVGLTDAVIEYLSIVNRQPIERYSCFISYSTNDHDFAVGLHSDLQNSGVRCWFAPHDMPIGSKILDEINTAIHFRDKLLLVLSEHSIRSDWVEDEVTKGFEEERKRGQTVLFPIRVDDAVMDTNEAWAAKLRARHIGDFTRWKEHDEYQKSFTRVLRDLTVKKDGVA